MILTGIAEMESRPTRLLVHQAEAIVDSLVEALQGTPGVRRIVPAGSSRRRKETIGDLDLLAETDDPAALMTRFTELGIVDRVVNRGGHKAAVQLLRGPDVDLMIMPPGEAGTYLIHFTGSKEHNVGLRALARDRGWSLSEKGFQRIDVEGQPLKGADAELRTFATEAEAYGFLGLPFIEPELREDHGEIEAALAGRLPNLIRQEDLRGDCHTHSDWSDGVHDIETMAEACRRRGYAYQVLTDHSVSLAIARGLTPLRVEAQRKIIAELNARFAREEAEGTAPPGDAGRGLPPAARLRARGSGRRRARLRRRPPGPLRRRGRLRPRLATPAARRADAADAQCDPQPARRHRCPPGRPDDPVARRPRPRLGGGLRGGGADRHGPRDERLAPSSRPVRGARSPRARARLHADDRFRRPQDRRARLCPLGHQPGAAGMGATGGRPQHALAGGAAGVGRGQSPIGSAGRDRGASRTIGVVESRAGSRRDLVLAATTIVGLSRFAEGSLVWLVAGIFLVALVIGTLQVLGDADARPDSPGVPIESLLTPAVAGFACLGVIRLVPIGLALALALLVTAILLDRTLRTESRVLLASRGPSEPDRTAIVAQAVLVAFLAFLGAAALVPGGLPEPGSPTGAGPGAVPGSVPGGVTGAAPGAVGGAPPGPAPLSESNLVLLATTDALVAGLLGYRVSALRVSKLRDALWSAATYATAVAIGAAALRAMDIPRLVGPAMLTLAFFLWDAFHGAPPARRRDPRWIWQTVVLMAVGVLVVAWNLGLR